MKSRSERYLSERKRHPRLGGLTDDDNVGATSGESVSLAILQVHNVVRSRVTFEVNQGSDTSGVLTLRAHELQKQVGEREYR